MKSGKFQFGITNDILEEYEEVLGNFYSPTLATNVIELLLNLPNGIPVTPYYKWSLIKDQDDNKFVDCAIACQADYIITHDRHFGALTKIEFPKVHTLKMEELKGKL